MENNLRYVFFGTPDFAAIVLEKLIRGGFKPEIIICNPDKPAGRNKALTLPPVKIIAQKYKLNISQPERLSDAYNSIADLNPELMIVAAYAKIIPEKFLIVPELGTIGVHPSLLPKYRGSSPIQSAILNGEKETGTTLFMLDEKMDHGKIIAEARLPISEKDNYESLTEKLAELSGDLLVKTLPEFLKNHISPEIQNESNATYTAKIKTEDAFIEPRELVSAINNGGAAAEKINRKARAFYPEPGVWTILEKQTLIGKIILPANKRIKIIETEIMEGKLKVKKIQIAGKKPLSV
ncbi:methionyl-tRNA formyltransferase [Patescibacteria group bacterium]|nr:methionyl-tRNA formyltransferase [Patescibacteria group bacterium]MCL5733715.1 methionyl-tRNA formyltransferase [Patescibacteria group bacterium]